MIKYIKQHLSIQIFILTCMILVGISTITYAIIAAVTPKSYLNEIERSIDLSAESLISHFDTMNLEECKNMLSVFSQEHDVLIQLYDENGRLVEADSEIQFMPSPDSKEESAHQTHETKSYLFSPRDSDMSYTVTVLANGQRVNLFTQTLDEILPYLLILILAVSVLVSWIYTRYLSKPIIRLSKASKELAGLNFNTRFSNTREDEIGVLSESLNELSESLSTALEELKDANASLKEDVEREVEMEKQQLSFFSAVSHELKTPITILKGQLQGMLYNVGGYKDRDKYLQRSFEVVENMEKLVLEILSVARMRSAGFSLHKKELDLEKMLQSLLIDYEEIAMHKDISMVCRLEPVRTVLADESLIKKVISNVLSNAFRYSPPESEVHIFLKQEQEDVCLAVENTGVMIPDDEIPKLFQPFSRREESRSRETGGSGLGLYLVKMILELHQIAFDMKNIENGVRFEILFHE